MELSAGNRQRQMGLDLLAAHLAGMDPDSVRAKDRLEDAIGAKLARFLVSALVPHPYPETTAA